MKSEKLRLISRILFTRNYNKMKQLITIILIICPCLLGAQELYNLKRCIELGLEQNYALRIVRNEQTISDNNRTIGNAGYLPTLDLSAGYSGKVMDADNGITKTSDVHDQQLNAGINLNWTIFDGFNIQANYERLKELQQMGELNTRVTIENFISELSAEYYNYVQQNIRLNNLESAVKLSKERLRIVEARYNIGAMSRLDMQQAKVDFNADSSMLIKQREILFTSKTRLNQLMAVEKVEQPLIVSDTVITFNALLDKNSIWEKALAANPYLLLARRDVNLSELERKQANSPNYPYLRLNAGYGYTKNMFDSNTSWQKNWGFNYGITLGFNLFDGFNTSRKRKNAKIQVQNKELQFQQLQLSVETDLSNAWMAYTNNIELVNLEKENLATARDNYEIAIERYKLGDLAGIELREVQNSLLGAEERLVQAQYNTKLCEISLLQISGQITSYMDME
jgi:outer membrane protein TolC